MADDLNPDDEIRALITRLYAEHGDPKTVAQVLRNFAAACDLAHLVRSAQRFRAAAEVLEAGRDPTAT
ncbi:MAG: hypothetical protein IT562_16270 [Alphaproteobacteria bacterium]|nr:hypothetical protein [Alphaproteobacteria bacterium]